MGILRFLKSQYQKDLKKNWGGPTSFGDYKMGQPHSLHRKIKVAVLYLLFLAFILSAGRLIWLIIFV